MMRSTRGAGARRRPRLALSVQHAAQARGLPARSTLRRWLLATLERDARVTLRFVGSAEGRRLNAGFRGGDCATNVLTFVYDDAIPDQVPPAYRNAPSLAGDVVICVPVLRREARARGIPLRAHCAHLVIHGSLHLQGYDHQRDADAALMESRETTLLRRLRYPDPYAPS